MTKWSVVQDICFLCRMLSVKGKQRNKVMTKPSPLTRSIPVWHHERSSSAVISWKKNTPPSNISPPRKREES